MEFVRTPPEGRSDYGKRNEKTHNRTTRLFARQRYFRVLRLFFAYFFLARQKKVCRRRHSCGVTAKNGISGEAGEKSYRIIVCR